MTEQSKIQNRKIKSHGGPTECAGAGGQGDQVKPSTAGIFGVICVSLLALGASAHAQQPRKIPWIGYLASGGSGPSPAFMQGLRELGYVETKNIAFVFRTTE